MKDKKPIIIANWKMKLGVNDSIELAKNLKSAGQENKEVVICPSVISLLKISEVLKKSKIKLGGQDCFWEDQGSYTGETSAQQLKEAGCEFVILGHSERRKNIGETDDIVHKKVKAALDAGLVPIICIGETFDQRQQGATDYILIQQVALALGGLKHNISQRIVVAYEPIWVIGSGQAILPEQASMANEVINQALLDFFPPAFVHNNVLTIYGGSVTSENVNSFSSLQGVDGVLVGGASMKAQEFINIIKNA